MTTLYINPDTFQPFMEFELVPKINGKFEEQYSIKAYLPVEPIQDSLAMDEDEGRKLVRESIIHYIKEEIDISNFQKIEQ